MIAAMIDQVGEQATTEWVQGLVKNLARRPKGGDRDQIKAVVSGQCDVAIVNTYYLAGMLNDADPKNRALAEQVKVFWLNQQDRGAHINVSGIAVTRHAPNAEQAKALLDFMLTPSSQAWYVQHNHEYPVLKGVALSDTVQAMGPFKTETVAMQTIGELNAAALKLMDRAGWQ